jgi:hypothetical protein
MAAEKVCVVVFQCKESVVKRSDGALRSKRGREEPTYSATASCISCRKMETPLTDLDRLDFACSACCANAVFLDRKSVDRSGFCEPD